MDERPDPEFIGWLAGGLVTATVGAVAAVRKLGIRLATPAFIQKFDGVNARLDQQTTAIESQARVLQEIAVSLGRYDERITSLDRRVSRLEQ